MTQALSDANAGDTHAASERIRRAGLRVTESRRAVYEALGRTPHASADVLFADVVRELPGTSLQSVYNALADFAQAGLVRRIQPAGHSGMFELRVADNHHHLVCSVCGAVEDVDCVAGEAPCLTPGDHGGFQIASAEVTFWGVCAPCRAASAPSLPLST